MKIDEFTSWNLWQAEQLTKPAKSTFHYNSQILTKSTNLQFKKYLLLTLIFFSRKKKVIIYKRIKFELSQCHQVEKLPIKVQLSFRCETFIHLLTRNINSNEIFYNDGGKPKMLRINTHTHTQKYIYIYIYIDLFIKYLCCSFFFCLYVPLSLSLYIYIYIYKEIWWK